MLKYVAEMKKTASFSFIAFSGFLAIFCLLHAPAGAGIPAITISNFQNLTGDPQNDWIGMSFSESFYTQLGKVKGIYLVERSQLAQVFSELKMNVSGAVDEESSLKAGKLIGAGYMVVGSVSKSGNTLLVNARLLETETGSVLKTKQIEGAAGDIFNMQRELAADIAKYFGKELKKTRLGFSQPKSVASEQEYSKGLVACFLKSNDYDALDCYQKAVDETPDFAEAYLGMGDSYSYIKDYEKALKKYNKAFELFYKEIDEEGISRTYYKIGEVHLFQGDYSGALSNFELSLRYGDSYEDLIYSRAADIYKISNNIGKAIEYQKLAVKKYKSVDNYYSYAESVSELADMYAGLKKYPEALKELKRAEKVLADKKHPRLGKIAEQRLALERK